MYMYTYMYMYIILKYCQVKLVLHVCPFRSSSTPPTKAQFAPVLRSKRRYSYSFTEEQGFLRALEVDLAKQTRRLQKLRLEEVFPLLSALFYAILFSD